MKTAGILLIIFGIMFSFGRGTAEAAKWERISEYEDTTIYIDNENINRISDTVTGAKFKIVFKEPSWVQSRPIDYYVIEQENNCSEKKFKVYQLTVYYRDGTNETFKKKEENDVNPDTFQSVIHEFMCPKRSQ